MKKKIKVFLYLTVMILFCMAFLPQNNAKAANNVQLNKTKTTLYVGETTNLKLTGTTVKSWTSSNKKVATVSSSGKVTAKSKGTTTITCKSENSKKYTCSVTVKNPSLNKTKATLNIGKTLTLKLTGATAKTWTSSNKKVATVSSKGKVTPKAKGTATITCKADNGKKYTCKVTVEMPVGETSPNGKYTAKGAITVYRALMEAGGIKWEPSLKGNWDKTIGKYPIEEWYLHVDNYKGAGFGTGYLYLDKGQPEKAAESSLKSFKIGAGGKSWKYYYLEVISADENRIYYVKWIS